MTPQLEALAMLNNMFESFDGRPVDQAILTRRDYAFLVQALTARTHYSSLSEAEGEATELVSLLLAVLEREGITGGARDKARAYLKRVRYSDIHGESGGTK